MEARNSGKSHDFAAYANCGPSLGRLGQERFSKTLGVRCHLRHAVSMLLSKTRGVLEAVGLVAAMVILAGCGGSSSEPVTSPASASASQLVSVLRASNQVAYWFGPRIADAGIARLDVTRVSAGISYGQGCDGGGCAPAYMVRTGTDRDLPAAIDGDDVAARCWKQMGAAVVLWCPGAAAGAIWTGPAQIEIIAGLGDERLVLGALRPMSAAARKLGMSAPKPFTCAEIAKAAAVVDGLQRTIPAELQPKSGCAS